MIPDQTLERIPLAIAGRLGCVQLTSEETGKKTVVAIFLDPYLLPLQAVNLTRRVAGSIDGMVPMLTNARGTDRNGVLKLVEFLMSVLAYADSLILQFIKASCISSL